MKAKVSKFIWGNISNISISRLNCSEEIILNIISLFKYKTVIIEIGDINKNSALFQKIRTLSINYNELSHNDSLYTDVIFIIDSYNLKELIHYIFISECDSFSIENIEDYSNWEKYLFNQINKQQLISNKIITLNIVVIINESQVDITFNKDIYDTKQVILNIKEQIYKRLFS